MVRESSLQTVQVAKAMIRDMAITKGRPVWRVRLLADIFQFNVVKAKDDDSISASTKLFIVKLWVSSSSCDAKRRN